MPEGHSEDPLKNGIKIIITSSASDKPLIQPHIHNSRTKKQLEKRFKNPSDPLNIVIVRVNRVFKGKEGGLVVDYIGIANELRKALVTYTQSRGKGNPTVDTHSCACCESYSRVKRW